MSIKKFIILFFICSTFFFLGVMILFFVNLNSTLSDYSWGDVSWIHQAIYNFFNGRPFQTSLYYNSGEGVIGNRFGYANQMAMHVNFTPYLITFPYILFPDLNWLYIIVIVFNIIGFSFFTRKLILHLSPQDADIKILFCLSFFFGGIFPALITYKCLFPLLLGPFILALYYYIIIRCRLAFFITAALIALLSEDSALWMISFGFYLFVFEKNLRGYSLFLLLFSGIYILLVTFILMPAVKYNMITDYTFASDIIVRLHRVFNGEYLLQFKNLFPVFGYALISFVIVFLLFGYREIRKNELMKLSGLILIAPASHWFISYVNGGGHHLIPVASMIYLSLIILVVQLDLKNKNVITPRQYRMLFLIIVMILLLFDLRYPGFWRSFIDRDNHQITSNKAVIKYVSQIPLDHSLTYWTNRGVEGFISNRSDLWRFPSYYDQADFLLIQKDAKQSFFSVNIPSGKFILQNSRQNKNGLPTLNISQDMNTDLNRILQKCGQHHSSGEKADINKGVVDRIINDLVYIKRSHIISINNEHMLVLKRIEKSNFAIPYSSIGFGWMKDIPAYVSKRFSY